MKNLTKILFMMFFLIALLYSCKKTGVNNISDSRVEAETIIPLNSCIKIEKDTSATYTLKITLDYNKLKQVADLHKLTIFDVSEIEVVTYVIDKDEKKQNVYEQRTYEKKQNKEILVALMDQNFSFETQAMYVGNHKKRFARKYQTTGFYANQRDIVFTANCFNPSKLEKIKNFEYINYVLVTFQAQNEIGIYEDYIERKSEISFIGSKYF